MLRESDIHIDMEPSHPKMGHLVSEAARDSAMLVERLRAETTTFPNIFPIRHPRAARAD